MERYIKLYDSVIDKNVCDSMITLFETQKDLQAVDRINPIFCWIESSFTSIKKYLENRGDGVILILF